MTKVAFLALRLAGIIGWAVRDDATSRPTAVDLKKPTALLTSEQFKQKLRDNAPLRASSRCRRGASSIPASSPNCSRLAAGRLPLNISGGTP